MQTGQAWAEEDIKRCREFFDGYAAQKGLDPLDPETWYFRVQHIPNADMVRVSPL